MAAEQSQVKLHWLNGSRAQGTLWLLEELQIPYELEIYHREKTMLAPSKLAQVHPLGKSPVVTITPPGSAEPIVLAESAFIAQYLCDHFGSGKTMQPKRWKDGQEGKIGGETEEWMRYQYIMYYAEGSFMPPLVTHFIMGGMRSNQVPFFVRPITKMVANQIDAKVVSPNVKKHAGLLESYLDTSPEGGQYLCGKNLTSADIMMAYPLIAGLHGGFDGMGSWDKGSFGETYPKLWAYMQRLEKEPGWQRSVEKIKQIEGSYSVLPTQE